MIVWLREKIFGKDAERWKSYLVTFMCLIVFTGIFVVLFVLIFADVENWDFVTSLYFTVVTMTTIGFGDLGEISIENKILKNFSEPTFQSVEDDNNDYSTPVFGFTTAILSVYRLITIAWMFFGISFMSAVFSFVVDELERISNTFISFKVS